MNLIKCKKCGNHVSKDEKSCPNCGAILIRRISKSFLILSSLGIVLILVGLVVLNRDSIPTSIFSSLSTGSSNNQDEENVHTAWECVKIWAKGQLNSPNTAVFPPNGHRHVTSLGDGRYRVISYVDSQNSFGATVRLRIEGIVIKVENGWDADSLCFRK